MTALSFSDIYCIKNAKEAFTAFYNLFKLFYNLCFPIIKIKISNKIKINKWITQGLKQSSKTKRKLYLQYKNLKVNKIPNRTKYRLYTKIFKKCMLKSQRIQYTKYMKNSKNKCKATWTIIQRNVSNPFKRNDITEIRQKNVTYKDPNDICKIFNDYFIYITNDHKKTTHNINSKNNSIESNLHTIFISPTNAVEIHRIIMSLKNSKCTGYDDINTEIVKLSSPAISNILSYIINLSFEEGYFPEQLKFSIVKPLFKKGTKSDLNNYRPITLIPIFSKIFERAMYNRLYSFLTKSKVLTEDQYGFRKGKSTTLACYDLTKYQSWLSS